MQKTLAAALLAAALIPTTAQAIENEDLLAVVAMPLAVAAVSEVTDVPMNDLIDMVTLMNDADVPPAQFIEVVRYAPSALLVETTETRLPQFMRVQYDNGVRGTALVNTIEEQFQVYGIDVVDLDVDKPRNIDVDARFLPASVVRDLAERKSHPHGGPPGQLKKERGLKTGAEVVHATRGGNRDRIGEPRSRGQAKGKGKGK